MPNTEDILFDKGDLEYLKVFYEYCNRAEMFGDDMTLDQFMTIIGYAKHKNLEVSQVHGGFFAEDRNRQILKEFCGSGILEKLLEDYYTKHEKDLGEETDSKDFFIGFAPWMKNYIEKIILVATEAKNLKLHHAVKVEILKRRLKAYDLDKSDKYTNYEIAKRTLDVTALKRESANRMAHRDIEDAKTHINNLKNHKYPFWRT